MTASVILQLTSHAEARGTQQTLSGLSALAASPREMSPVQSPYACVGSTAFFTGFFPRTRIARSSSSV